MTTENKATKTKDKKYSKDSFLKSKANKDRKDMINALLEDDKQYTKKDVEKLIENYLEREV